jgi:hypothetical protein
VKLTKVQREILECCRDWTAPFEVAKRRRENGVLVYSGRMRSRLHGLHAIGLLQFGPQNETFKLTDAGCEALAAQPVESGGKT